MTYRTAVPADYEIYFSTLDAGDAATSTGTSGDDIIGEIGCAGTVSRAGSSAENQAHVAIIECTGKGNFFQYNC